ncbi:hypothetical protein [Tahibacter amnicola]|uniref:Intradiol ring-cleavage dioxygenases domain-containing protein n=1 Tax=Tahibacter amnicola TaxID=2976241 RepID=A0ABY6BEK2_9GAMM|nr:hypothetical protein [Tahibacter amnicola]UXI67046.1 hypothetical protein N4264_20175 [Tahibacter amnicola]
MAPWLLAITIASMVPPTLAAEPVIGGPCDGCEEVFRGQPAATSSTARIAPEGEKGEPLTIRGTVYAADGETPAAGIIVYGYHTDASGVYPSGESRHGRLRGWARTDGQGRYEFSSIRPAAYPGRGVPAHIHMHIIEPDVATYYIDDIHFTDDPLLPPQVRRSSDQGRGGSGLVTPTRDETGSWQVRRDIVLRRNIEKTQ